MSKLEPSFALGCTFVVVVFLTVIGAYFGIGYAVVHFLRKFW